MGSRKFQTPLAVRIIVRPALAVLASIMVANSIMESVTSSPTLRTTNDTVNKKETRRIGTLGPLGLSSSSGRTSDFRSGNRGSIPLGSTNHSLSLGPLLLWAGWTTSPPFCR